MALISTLDQTKTQNENHCTLTTSKKGSKTLACMW